MAEKRWNLSEFAEVAKLLFPHSTNKRIVCLQKQPRDGMSCHKCVSLLEYSYKDVAWVGDFMWLPGQPGMLPNRDALFGGSYKIVPGKCSQGHPIGKLGTLRWKLSK